MFSLRDRVKREFMLIAGFPLDDKQPNPPDGQVFRNDSLFMELAGRIYDKPEILETLLSRIGDWQKTDDFYTTRVIEGYLLYIGRDYEKAAGAFLSALLLCPEDLDTWAALAFSLNHLGDSLGSEILFNHDIIASRAVSAPPQGFTLENIRSWSQEARENNLDYSRTFREYWPGLKVGA